MIDEQKKIEIQPRDIPEWFASDLQISKQFIIKASRGCIVQEVFDFMEDKGLKPGRIEELFPFRGYDENFLWFPGSLKVVRGNYYCLKMTSYDSKQGKITVYWQRYTPDTKFNYPQFFFAVSRD
ncbi:MAG: hypothetical protein GF365_01080 [Candidatus Buchananbacteria bacterium]|nr:hypothetical protein [Candidatus Buchananbacteria bacterium]